MKTLQFHLTGFIEVPDNVIIHEDPDGSRLKIELNDSIYSLQMNLLKENIYEFKNIDTQEMAEDGINVISYDTADFIEE
jgi:hypothetical protein